MTIELQVERHYIENFVIENVNKKYGIPCFYKKKHNYEKKYYLLIYIISRIF